MLTFATAGLAAAGTPGSGDATATGNQSGTNANQSLNIKDGGFATVDGGVDNNGTAESQTGDNEAVGNSDENEAGIDDGILDDPEEGKININENANESEGEATVSSGWAWSAGNQSQTDLDQTGKITGGQNLVVLTQGSLVLNRGLGLADTGSNIGGPVVSGNAWALGNWSENDVDQVADATSGVSVLILGQVADIDNFGDAYSFTGDNDGDVTSGNAKSQGNESRDRTAQNTVADGDTLAAAVVQQASRNRNHGEADALTGHNLGDAGEGDDTDDLDQEADPDLTDLETLQDLYDINF